MFCPSCGTTTSTEVRFCRKCGLELSEISQALSTQREQAGLSPGQYNPLVRRKQIVERLGVVLLATGGLILVSSVFFGIIRLMITKGEFWAGLIFLAFLTALIVGGLLIAYSSRIQKSGKPAELKDPTAPDTARLPDNPPFEPVESVTDRTTEMLVKQKVRREI